MPGFPVGRKAFGAADVGAAAPSMWILQDAVEGKFDVKPVLYALFRSAESRIRRKFISAKPVPMG